MPVPWYDYYYYRLENRHDLHDRPSSNSNSRGEEGGVPSLIDGVLGRYQLTMQEFGFVIDSGMVPGFSS